MNIRENKKALIFTALACVFAGTASLAFESREEKEAPIRGTIPLKNLTPKLADLAKISVSDAIKAAESSSKGKAKSAKLENEDGFLVYAVEISAASGEQELIVDAGSGQILSAQKNHEKEDGEEHEDQDED